MDIYLGFAKRDLGSGYKAGELVLVQAHRPLGGDLDAFEWRVEDWPTLAEADTYYAPVSDDVVMIARHEIVGNEVREKQANNARLDLAKVRMQSLLDAQAAAGREPDPKLQAVVDSISEQTKPGLLVRMLRAVGLRR